LHAEKITAGLGGCFQPIDASVRIKIIRFDQEVLRLNMGTEPFKKWFLCTC